MSMRSGSLVTAIAVVLSGCATAPISFLSSTPRPLDDAYSCALRKVNELGYTVSNTNKDAGFITGTKQTSGLGTKLLTGSEYHDQLTVSIFDDSAAGGRRIRVTAGRVDQKSNLFGTSTHAIQPSTAGIGDANTVLTACGSGPVTQQSDMVLESAARRLTAEAVETK